MTVIIKVVIGKISHTYAAGYQQDGVIHGVIRKNNHFLCNFWNFYHRWDFICYLYDI
jgi:hypothetical protein